MTDRPWQRGDKMIAFKGRDTELTCYLKRQIDSSGNWYVSLNPDLKEEFTWYHPSSLTPADPEPKPEAIVTDRPWKRGDKVIVYKGKSSELTCWLTRQSAHDCFWFVSGTPDLKEECAWYDKFSLTLADPEPTPKAVAIDPVNDPNNLDHIDLVTQHLGYNLGRAVECLWAADQGDWATSLQELRKAKRHIQIEITRREWKEANR